MNKRLRASINVQIEVTGACGHRCLHCYNFWREKGKRPVQNIRNGTLSEKEILSIVRKLNKAEVFNISITGGEPLLNYSVTLAGIKLAQSMNMGIGLNSTLVLLTDKKARDLKQAGLNHVLTSILCPTAEIHDSVTQKRGSFNKLLEGVEVAHDAGIKVSANMVVSQVNKEYVIETAKVVSKLEIKSFMATKAGCPGNCSDFSHLQIDRAQLVKFLNDLCWVHDNLGLHVDSLEPIPFCGLHGVSRPELFASRRCNAGGYDGNYFV